MSKDFFKVADSFWGSKWIEETKGWHAIGPKRETLESAQADVLQVANDRPNKLESLLRDIINDFDQTGCSSGVGVVSTATINEARSFLGMKTLEDEVKRD